MKKFLINAICLFAAFAYAADENWLVLDLDNSNDITFDYVSIRATANDGIVIFKEGTEIGGMGVDSVSDIVGYGQMTYIEPGWEDYSSGYNFFLEFYNGDAIAGYTNKFTYQTLRDAVYVPDSYLPDWGDVPLAMTIQPAPEPSSGLLLLIGGALVGLRRKRRVA